MGWGGTEEGWGVGEGREGTPARDVEKTRRAGVDMVNVERDADEMEQTAMPKRPPSQPSSLRPPPPHTPSQSQSAAKTYFLDCSPSLRIWVKRGGHRRFKPARTEHHLPVPLPHSSPSPERGFCRPHSV